ncbi:hypothetical protein JNL27_11965 [bacterium]|nr:hypothetical protein [bacterium]
MNSSNLLKLIGIGGAVVILALLNIESPFIPVGIIALIVIVVFVIRNIRIGILILFATKPIIDATYAFQILPGLSLLQITGVLFPLTVLIYALQNRPVLHSPKLMIFFYFFLWINVLSALLTIVHVSTFGSFLFSLVTFFQVSNMIAVYFLMPNLISNNDELKKFLQVLLLAGLFPIITGILQSFNLLPELKTLRTTGDLIRISGWYYDSSNMRFYSFQTLVTSIFFIYHFRPAIILRVSLYVYTAACLFITYKTYSKSAIGIIAASFLIYVVLSKRIILGLVGIFIFLTLWTTSDFISRDIEKLVWKEVKYTESSEGFNTNSLLSGRIGIWDNYLNEYTQSDIVDKAFGLSYVVGRNAHNDFLRILVSNGFVGLGLYGVILLSLLYYLLTSYLSHRDILSIFSIILFGAFIIDSVGLTMTLQPAYCWFSFGIMSLSINRRTALLGKTLIPSRMKLDLQTKTSTI